MTATLASEATANHSESVSSEFDTLPPASDIPPDVTPDTKFCLACDKPVLREPGTRGRLPKYHPACKPTIASRVSGVGSRSKVRSAKAATEADECVAMYKSAMVKLAMALSIVDKYDGFCVLANLPSASENLKGVLIAHDKLRADFLAMKSGGSIFGFAMSQLMMIVPIVAHHGFIPNERIAELLVNLPLTLFRIQQKMKEGESALTDMMADFANGTLAKQQPQRREASPNGSAPWVNTFNAGHDAQGQ